MVKLSVTNSIGKIIDYKILFNFYILSLFLHIPLINNYDFFKISEFLFLILLFPFAYYFLKEKKNIYFDKIDLVFLSYPISFIPNIFLLNFSYNSVLGFFSGLYLFLIYFVTKHVSIKFNLDKFYLLKQVTYLGFICGLITLIGVFLYLFDINIGAIHTIPKYPFLLFNVYFRSQAFLGSASMLAMYCIIAFLSCYFCYKNFRENKYIIIITIIIIGIFFTFSKSIVLLFSSLFLIIYFKIKKNIWKNLILFIIFLSILFHSFFSNFLIINKKNEFMKSTYFTVNNVKPLLSYENFNLIPTYYFFQKKKNFEVIKNNFPYGIGYKNFNNYRYASPEYSEKDFEYLNKFNPHSTLLGALAENGILNLTSIILILFFALKISYNLSEKYLFIILFYMLLEFTNADFLSIKLLWIFFGLIAYEYKRKSILI